MWVKPRVFHHQLLYGGNWSKCMFGIRENKIVMLLLNARVLSSIVSYDASWYQPGIEVTVREKSIKILISEMEFWKHMGSISHDGALPWIETTSCIISGFKLLNSDNNTPYKITVFKIICDKCKNIHLWILFFCFKKKCDHLTKFKFVIRLELFPLRLITKYYSVVITFNILTLNIQVLQYIVTLLIDIWETFYLML